LVNIATAKLHEIDTKPTEKCEGFYPWRLFLLIKWGFEYGGENYPLRNADNNMLVKLINMLHEFEYLETDPFLEENNYISIQKFLRTSAFQQFWLQKRLDSWKLARQNVLFCDLPSEHPIHINFEQSMRGVRMVDFLVLSVGLWSWLEMESNNISFQPEILFQNLGYPKDIIFSYCNAISLTPDGVKKYLRERKKAIENPYLQLKENSPFIRYPVLKLDGSYLVYSQKLLKETILNIFYDVMKAQGGSDLAKKFGFILEEYVKRDLASLNLDYYTEKELSRTFPGVNVTDFLVPFSDLTLFIEVKAIEMRPIVKVSPKNKSLRRELYDSIIKGTIQGFSLANSISLGLDPLDIPSRSNFFLMIVTYRDLYLGAGDVVWEEFLRDTVEPVLNEKNISVDLIPAERIIILSIDEFDMFVSVLWQGSATVSDIFCEMLKTNQKLETRNLMFSQHLDKLLNKDQQHPFLNKEFEALRTTITEKSPSSNTPKPTVEYVEVNKGSNKNR
jgi:hypothetical protein